MSAKTLREYGQKIAMKYGYGHRNFEINKGDPDELFFKEGFMFLVELKYGYDKLRKHQEINHKVWRKKGFLVFVVDDNSEWEDIFKEAERVRTKGLSKEVKD